MTSSFLQFFPYPFACVVPRHGELEILYQNDFFAALYNPDNQKNFTPLFDIEPSVFLEAMTHGQSLEHTTAWGNKWLKFKGRESVYTNQACWLIVVDDITALKNEQQRLMSAVLHADHLNEMKSNFLATMSHEIRTPMQSIYGILELLKETSPDADAQKLLSTAKNSASGLLEILDDILDLAKVDAGKMELDYFEIPLRTLARGLLEGLSIKVRGKPVQLIDDIDETIPFVVMGDPKRLRQIILNLVGNSIKFTDAGSVTLRITPHTHHLKAPDRGFNLRFEVIDTGMGMSDEVASRLFKPFTQADSSTSRQFGGTGLGLSICRKLVELMGGQIGVTSEVGKGSTFWFEIPTEKASEDTVIDLPDLDGITVLSVEDHPRGAQEIVNSLKSMGAEVISTADTATALDWLKKRPFDVAVFDYGLPGEQNGLDLLKQAAVLRPYMGLILYTVHDDLQIQYDLKTIGATYLSKPASRLGLGQTVKDCAKQSHMLGFDGPRNILIAEDTDTVRDILMRQFDRLGIKADFVENGQQAYDALQSGRYGLLITDLHMPKMDGYELVHRLRDDEETKDIRKLPIIAMTADVQLAHRQSYMIHGFDECLLKPVSMGQLKRLFVRWGLIHDDETQPEPDAAPQAVNQNAALPAFDSAQTAVTADDHDDTGLPPAIDTQAMVFQMGAFDESAIEMLHLFVDMTQPLIEKLNKAYADNNRPMMKEIAHSLKGSARSACCPHLGQLCDKLQTDLEQGKAPTLDAIKRIHREFDRVARTVHTLAA